MNRITLSAVVATALSAAMVFYGCGDSGITSNNAPALSNVTGLDSVYAGYFRLYDPPDTIRLSFDYNGSKVSLLDVSATLDSGKTWIPVTTVTPTSANKATVVWPLHTDADTGHFRFFGYKEGFIKISDKTSGASIQSPTFSIIGNAPFVLTAPKGGETFSVSDSIRMVYSVSTHLTAQIKPCIRPNDTTMDWREVSSLMSSTVLTAQRGPIRSYVRAFRIADFNTAFDWTGKWATYPLQIMLRDYGSGGGRVYSGLITITSH